MLLKAPEMYLPVSILLLVSTLLSVSSAQQQQPVQDAQITCLRFPPSIAGNQTFNPEAITALSEALSNNIFDPPLPGDGITLSPFRATRIGWADSGGYQICIQNFWFFKTLTIPLDTLSQAVSAMGSSCCDDAAQEGISPHQGAFGRPGRCQDAKALVKATDGSEVRVVAQDYGDRCCGMFTC